MQLMLILGLYLTEASEARLEQGVMHKRRECGWERQKCIKSSGIHADFFQRNLNV